MKGRNWLIGLCVVLVAILFAPIAQGAEPMADHHAPVVMTAFQDEAPVLAPDPVVDEDEVPVSAEEVETPEEKSEGPGIGSAIWEFLNSGLGITIVITLIGIVVGWIKKKPKWAAMLDKYGPMFISAVKLAEKGIPNSAGGTMGKFDGALQLMVKWYEESVKRRASVEEIELLKMGLSATHDKLEQDGTLGEMKKVAPIINVPGSGA